MQRIISCCDTGETFADCPPLPEYQGAFGLVGFEGFPAKVIFSEDFSSYIRERVWSEGQEIIDLPNGEIELRFQAADEDKLVGWVFSFGSGAALLEPEYLHEYMLEEIEAIRNYYMDETCAESVELEEDASNA